MNKNACLLLILFCCGGLQYPYAQFKAAMDLPVLFQQYHKSITDNDKAHSLLRLSDFFLLKPGQEKQDLDTALLMAAQSEEICKKLKDNKGIDDARSEQEAIYAEAHEYGKIRQLFPLVSDTGNIKGMWNLLQGNLYFHVPGAFEDTALSFMKDALHFGATAPSARWQLKLLIKLAAYYYGATDGDNRQPPFLHGETFLSAHTGWQDSIVNWLKVYLAKNTGGLQALAAFRERIVRPQPPQETADLLRTVREDIPKYLGDQALCSRSMARQKRAIQQFWFIYEFEKTFPPAMFDVASPVNLALLYIDMGDYTTAYRVAHELLAIQEKGGENGREDGENIRDGSVYWLNGNVSYKLNKPEEGMGFYIKAVKADKKKYKLVHGPSLSQLAAAMVSHGQAEEALVILKDNLEQDKIYQLYSDVDRKLIYECMGMCYQVKKDYKAAEAYYLRGLAIARKITFLPLIIVSSYNFLGDFYMASGQGEKARHYLNELITLPPLYSVPVATKQKVHQYLFTLDSTRGRADSAYYHLKQYKILGDSIFSATKTRNLQELTTKYETQQKDSSLHLQQQRITLLTQEGQIKEAALNQSRFMRNGLIAGAFMLIAFLLLLYNRYRIKQKTNAELEAQREAIYNSNLELTELNGKQERLLSEKEWLIREVHHRVKNNLQIVISLLNMQAEEVQDQKTLSAFSDIGSRIRAVSLVHQKLYREGHDLALVHMPEYIRELVVCLEEGFVKGNSVRFDIVVDDIYLSGAQCMPVGLILNEAVLNAIKYAFPSGTTGIIHISMKQENGCITLAIADNGVGMPAEHSVRETSSLGMELIETLVLQLDGQLTTESHHGLLMKITFERIYSLIEDVTR